MKETSDLENKKGRVKRDFWKTLRKAARQIPFVEDLVAAYFCAFDPAIPPRVRLTLLGALGYFVLPLDVIPDFIVGIGFGDDAAVLLTVINTLRAHITQDHQDAARHALSDHEVSNDEEPSG